MDKQELIHTHAMLAEVRQYVNDSDDVPTPEYDEMDVNPISLTASAEDHEDAVFALANDLSANLDVGDGVESDTLPGITAD